MAKVKPKTRSLTVVVPIHVPVTVTDHKDDPTGSKMAAEAFTKAKAMLPAGAALGVLRTGGFGLNPFGGYGKRIMEVKGHHGSDFLDCSSVEQERLCYLHLLRRWYGNVGTLGASYLDPEPRPEWPFPGMSEEDVKKLPMNLAMSALETVVGHKARVERWEREERHKELARECLAKNDPLLAERLFTRLGFQGDDPIEIHEVADPEDV